VQGGSPANRGSRAFGPILTKNEKIFFAEKRLLRESLKVTLKKIGKKKN
jgi:hypothetical protein